MPTYVYACRKNGREVEVQHPIGEGPSTWAELCALAQIDPGDTDPRAFVRRLAQAPALMKDRAAADLRDAGFQQLVRKGRGDYSRVTAEKGPESVRADDDEVS